MSNLLVILSPRRIGVCIRGFERLDIDKLWVRNMSEYDIARAWPEILDRAEGYSGLILCSDDGIVHQHALEAVVMALESGLDAVTGYSNLSQADMRVNITRSPLGSAISEEAYDFYALAEAMEHPEPRFRTWFAGMCLTGMSREMWGRYPFQTVGSWPGFGSDFSLSQRLQADGVPIWAVREGFVWHAKPAWNKPDHRLLVGQEPPEITLERVKLEDRRSAQLV